MIGCGTVASFRSDKKLQEELENENLYRFIYTTGVFELQLSFRVNGMVIVNTMFNKVNRQKTIRFNLSQSSSRIKFSAALWARTKPPRASFWNVEWSLETFCSTEIRQ
jgi:hypothetical protein